MELQGASRITSGVLLLLLGLARGAGGIALMVRGPGLVQADAVSATAATAVGVGLGVVGALCLLAGAVAVAGLRGGVVLTLVALALFVIGGLVNGTVLFGAPRIAGVVGNTLAAAVIAALAVMGRGSERRRATSDEPG